MEHKLGTYQAGIRPNKSWFWTNALSETKINCSYKYINITVFKYS